MNQFRRAQWFLRVPRGIPEVPDWAQQLSRARTRVLIVDRERENTFGRSFKPSSELG
jgi:hypothetical protein